MMHLICLFWCSTADLYLAKPISRFALPSAHRMPFGARACAAISLCLRVPGSTKTVSGSTCQFNWSTITIEFDHKK